MTPDPERRLAELESFGVRLGLGTVRDILRELGEPQRRVPAVLVAGTNGKGSVSALVASILTAAGYRTGLYTSPHLESVEERIRIDGAVIDRGDLEREIVGVIEVASRVGGSPPTYFEALTLVAMRLFAERRLDVAVLEVGLGGRLDATNAAEPVVSVVTPVARDHTEYLGETLAAIAREKAGILRPGVPAVVWQPEPEAARELHACASAVGTPLVTMDDRCRRRVVAEGAWDQRVEVETARARYRLRLSLAGGFQAGNAALATVAAETLADTGFGRVDRRAIETGIGRCVWPGRLERVVLAAREVVLDAAHNDAGAELLCRHLERWLPAYDLLFGALADKEVGNAFERLTSRARHVVLTAPPSSRSRAPGTLASRLAPPVDVVDDWRQALTVVLAGAGPPVVCCGSIYLVGAIRAELRCRFGVPCPAAGPWFGQAVASS